MPDKDSAPLGGRLPKSPPADLDPFLDAASRCFARHGYRRTTVPDIADELGVSRATVYRRLGTVERAAELLFAREINVLVQALAPELRSISAPEGVVRIVSTIVTHSRKQAVARKMLSDEPELVGRYVISELRTIVRAGAHFIAPILSSAMSKGALARRDPEILAEWLMRIGISLIITPPRGDLEPFLREVLIPVLTPGAKSRD